MPLSSTSSFFLAILALALFHLTWILFIVGLLHFSLRRHFSPPEKRYALSLFSLACLALAIPASCWLAFQTCSASSHPDHGKSATLIVSSPNTIASTAAEYPPSFIPNTNVPAEAQKRSEIASPTSQFHWLSDSFATTVSVCYFVGLGFMLTRLAMMFLASHWLMRNATVVENKEFVRSLNRLASKYGINTPPRLLTSSKVLVPYATGIFRSSILIPSSMLLSCLSVQEINSILSHELAHIRRHDALLLLLQRCLETVLFFHPVTWWISRDLSNDREYCCDQWVIRAGVCPIEYSQTLCRIAELTQSKAKAVTVQTAVAINGNSSTELVRRIRTLLQPVSHSTTDSATSSLILSVAATSTLALITTLALNLSADNQPQQVENPNSQSVENQEPSARPKARYIEAMEQKYRFRFREHRSDYPEGLKIAKGLIAKAEAEEAPLRIVAQLYYNASQCARFIQLNHRDSDQRSNMQIPLEILHNVTGNPARFFTDYNTAVWYTNCAGLEAAIMEDGQAKPSEIESYLEKTLAQVNAQTNLTKKERRLLDCDVRMDIADISISSKKWNRAVNWLTPIFEQTESFLSDEVSAARLAMSARQQSMFLYESGDHEACVELVDQMCKKFATAESLPMSARIRNQCMLRGKQFVNYGDGKHSEILKNAVEQYRITATLAESFTGPDRAAVLLSCLNMHRLALSRTTVSNAEVKATISKTILLIETETGLQQGEHAAWMYLDRMLRIIARKLNEAEAKEIKQAVEELKQRIAKRKVTSLLTTN